MNGLQLDGILFHHDDAPFRFDLDVRRGEWMALIGPSGAGKSTLLDLAAGFIAPDAGRIQMAARDVTDTGPAERPLSIVFQDDNLFPHLTAEENVAIGIAPGLRIGRRARERARQALGEVGLGAFAQRRPAAMSGGERQRVGLARAFLRERPVLLLDEPFAALGPALRRQMLDLLAASRARRADPPTVLMVTHHPEDARGVCDRVAFLEGGVVRAVGETDLMLGAQAPTAVRRYLGALTPGAEPAP
ncbi:ATP-binding cassette domain-containing protein [Aureimonas jatrophae]|uniref:Thiamine transport system ATP-binding protein n=1 Tax=Aureimonas jatrophae TaxID=1166073 RepID=A0A1H0HJT0_9HYPH|nr:ATP-binding cassette domain-containing protein [Aureimonas jatrophae]MBB3950627.1 thiamine transport system ATP-binding protein [Aureimonas jatrophae]SDO19432.1 thiamine transport system ATP-binding protein [Aureimonas jatrophae]